MASSSVRKSESYKQHQESQNNWRWQLKNRISSLTDIQKWVNLTPDEKHAIEISSGRLKMAITPHFASLMDKTDPRCAIRRQAIPSLDEFNISKNELVDPCGEEKHTVSPGLIHRYPDRVLLLITDACAMYCRHCTRRRIVGSAEGTLRDEEFEKALEYIRNNKDVRDVLISGGDPLLLSDSKLDYIFSKIKSIDHVDILRVGTRVPVTMPMRITPELVNIMKKYQPFYISIHFNHPKEISEQTKAACGALADAGMPLGSQTVLLKGINDRPSVMKELVHELLKIRVKPYYLYQCDLAPGTEHFRTPVKNGIDIIESIRGYTTGYAVPTFVIDAPGGGGKVPINPDYIVSRNNESTIIRNYEGKAYIYPEPNTDASKILARHNSKKRRRALKSKGRR